MLYSRRGPLSRAKWSKHFKILEVILWTVNTLSKVPWVVRAGQKVGHIAVC